MSIRSEHHEQDRDCPFAADNFSIGARLPAMMPRRIRELRRRVATGYYDRPEVVRETARRILNSGDIPKSN